MTDKWCPECGSKDIRLEYGLTKWACVACWHKFNVHLQTVLKWMKEGMK